MIFTLSYPTTPAPPQACPAGSIDFRAQQCAAYNNASYSGKGPLDPFTGTSCTQNTGQSYISFDPFTTQSGITQQGCQIKPNLSHIGSEWENSKL